MYIYMCVCVYIYIYIYICMYIYICVCVRECMHVFIRLTPDHAKRPRPKRCPMWTCQVMEI